MEQQRIWLEIEMDGRSVRVTDRQTGSIVMSVQAGVIGGSALHHFKEAITEVLDHYVSNLSGFKAR